MALHKPTNIPKLTDIATQDDPSQVLGEINAFGSKTVSKNDLHYLAQTVSSYPVIPVEGKCLLLAVNSAKYQGLVWLSGWLEVVSAYKNVQNVYYARLKINGTLVDVSYDSLYPKDIIKLSERGLLVNFDYVDQLSKHIFRCLSELEVCEQTDSIGFITKDGKLTFIGYDEEPQVLDYTKDMSLTDYINGLNKLPVNTALMFALCCSCASLFLAFLSMVCGLPLMSFIISFYGKTGTGKSTAQTLMASMFTYPKDKKLYISFFGTLNAIVKNLTRKFGVPQIFDEATVSDGLNMESLIYMLSLEQDKNRCNSNAELRTPDTWKLIAITSSENRLLSDSHMHNRGLDARLLSFELAFTDNAAQSDAINKYCNKYYGILGKAMAEHLLSAEPDEIALQYDACKASMRNAIDNAASFDLAERLINEYAVILLAGEVLVELGVNIDIDGITAIMAENCNSIREATDIAGKYYHHLVNNAVLHPYAEGIKKDEQTGSVAFIDELFLRVACGYGGSIGAIKAMGGTELNLTDDELYSLVEDWRRSSPNIVKLWSDVQSVAVKVITDQSSMTFGRLKFSFEIGILFIELPSDRRLSYVRPKVEKDDNGKTIITYEGVGDNKKWLRLKTYGAKLVENITQGIARDLLLHSMAAMKDMDIVGHVHDEVIVECDPDTSVEQVCHLMEQTPDWAEGLLLRADGYECEFYMKQ